MELAIKYVEGMISELQNTGSLTNETAMESAKWHLEYQRSNAMLLPFMGPFEAWVETGRSKIAQVRHGRRFGEIPPTPEEIEVVWRDQEVSGTFDEVCLRRRSHLHVVLLEPR